jgi:hypothetical protein
VTNYRIPNMIIRLTWVVNIILGLGFWTGHWDSLQSLHMIIGILLVLSLFWIALLYAQSGGSLGLTIGAFVTGALLYLVGITQSGIGGTLIQVVHLLLAIVAIGIAEMMGAQLGRRNAVAR